MLYLHSTYSAWTVAASLLIASFASYVALDLAKRVRSPDLRVAQRWWAGGSLAMGTGIWCMHFVGMLAFSLPISLGYSYMLTAVSWLAGVATSAVALSIASRDRVDVKRLAFGALAMGAGISTMHYTGMFALDMTLGIVWDPAWIAVSILIAVGASAAALLIFSWLRTVSSTDALPCQFAASLVMGIAVCGMHYTGMTAASFPAGTLCLSAGALAGTQLAALVSVSSVALLAATLFTSTVDARMQSKTARLAGFLKTANAQLQTANEELRQRAFLDPLTGLANRLLFEDRLAQALARAERARDRPGERHAPRPAVLFVDLDGFKAVNDSLGHTRGDQVLKEAALRLRLAARDGDTVARIGGDEFVVLMEGVTALADCIALARRMVEALARPFQVADREIRVSGSVGVVLHNKNAASDKLVANADSAMYAAKQAGGNTYAVFEAHMETDALEQLSLQSDLRCAIDKGELALHYQPKIDATSGQIRGVEALLRWAHPVRGMVGPDVFIPIAERFGLMGAIGDWVIEQACRQMGQWGAQGMRMRVAINLSVHQLRDKALVERIGAALQKNQVDPAQLLCEITESVAMENIEFSQSTFDQLASLGVFLSIDDFGTGYSSLSYLSQLPAKQLKIDRSFVRDIEIKRDARAIVSAVIQLAHALSLRVVAEGVETEGQEQILVELGCDELQGYFFARPMPAEAMTHWAAGAKPVGSRDFSPSSYKCELIVS